jgi:hypothetical protein
MIRISNGAASLRLKVTLCGVVASFFVVSAASATDLNFNVANGNFTTTGNWVNAADFTPAAAAPTIGDNAFVRNGGTVTVNSDVSATEIRIGARQSITPPDYNSDTLINSPDYILWRKGFAPLTNDSTPATIGPEDYLLWRKKFGSTNADNDIGGAGTLMWTAGEILGPVFGTHVGGPVLRVGRHVNLTATQLTEYDYPGIVVQNGPTTKINLFAPESKLNIGDDGTTPTPLSSYTLMDGTIGLSSGVNANAGANGNDGIAVKNGSFTMLGGQINNVTTYDSNFDTLNPQRFLTIANQSGNPSGVAGTENYATATFTGGVVDVWGGIRIAPSTNSRGYLNINGPMTITTGGDTSIGYNATNGVGEVNMSAGTLNVGRNGVPDLDSNGNPRTSALQGRLQVGHRGRGTLNMSGGTINVTREIRVGAEYAAGGSILNQTGGTIVTPNLNMAVSNDDPLAAGYLGATILINGPTASFTSGVSIISQQGKATFEVRQGTALLGNGGNSIELGYRATSEPTINLKGGKLTLGGTVQRTITSGVAPVVKLTGGTLEFNNTTTTAAQGFRVDLNNEGSTLLTKANTLLQVTVGSQSPANPANFNMTSGSWTLDLGLHTALGADWFNVQNGTGALTGGTLNLNYLTGFTPTVGDKIRILRANLGTSLGAMTISGVPDAANWVLHEVPISNISFPLDEEIQLWYGIGGSGSGGGLGGAAVPEPSTVALMAFAAVGLLTKRGARSRR